MNKRELATVLAALRNWQSEIATLNIKDVDDGEHFSEVTPLSVEEIDELCESLNGPQPLELIQQILSGNEWNMDIVDAIAEVVRDAGYEIKEAEL